MGMNLHKELLSVTRVMEERCKEPHSDGLMPDHGSEHDLLLCQGLRAHVPRSRIWPSIRAWEDCSSHLAETLQLSTAVAGLLQTPEVYLGEMERQRQLVEQTVQSMKKELTEPDRKDRVEQEAEAQVLRLAARYGLSEDVLEQEV